MASCAIIINLSYNQYFRLSPISDLPICVNRIFCGFFESRVAIDNNVDNRFQTKEDIFILGKLSRAKRLDNS